MLNQSPDVVSARVQQVLGFDDQVEQLVVVQFSCVHLLTNVWVKPVERDPLLLTLVLAKPGRFFRAWQLEAGEEGRGGRGGEGRGGEGRGGEGREGGRGGREGGKRRG